MRIYLTGDENANKELRSLLKGKAEFSESLGNDIDLVIESTNFPAKKKAENISAIDKNIRGHIPVFSSSLCIPVYEQCSFTSNPERLIGIGLYSTFSKAKMIEIAPSKITDEKVLKNAENTLTDLGLNYSVVPDKAGMVFPRIVSMIINEAVQVYSEKIASKEDIDIAMKLGTNYPCGPLEWADRLGIELVYNILSALQRDFGEDRYRPHPLLKEMVIFNKSFY